MNRHTGVWQGFIGLLGGVVIGLGSAHAAICPVGGCTSTTQNTVSIYDFKTNNDITSTWLPDPGVIVKIVVRSGYTGTGPIVIPSLITLVAPVPVSSASFVAGNTTNPFINMNSLTTTAYPGTCTNTGSSTDFTPDFTLAPLAGDTISGWQLNPVDCGGAAVIKIGNDTFILPADTDRDGIPDIVEARYCPAPDVTCLKPLDDNDSGQGNGQTGDGISAFDEAARGFMVSGMHVRTSPTQKDIFVQMVTSAQLAQLVPLSSCASTSLFGNTTYFPNGPIEALDDLKNLISSTAIHAISATEWVDRFNGFSYQPVPYPSPVGNVSGIVYHDANNVLTLIAPAEDRQINQNAVFPLTMSGAVPTSPVQKGIRIIECTDTSAAFYGLASQVAQPDTSGDVYVVVYTQKIATSIGFLVSAYPTLKPAYQTWAAGATSPTVQPFPAGVNQTNFLIKKTIQFIVAMESGHSTALTPTQEGTKTNIFLYGYHHSPTTGSDLDQAIQNTQDKVNNNFFIPTLYNTADEANFKIH